MDMQRQEKPFARAGVWRLLNALTCMLLVAAAAVRRDGRLLGRDVCGAAQPAVPAASGAVSPSADGTALVDTSLFPENPSGFGGPVAVRVAFAGGRVVSAEPVLPNDETPSFFGMLGEAGFWTRWNGLTAAEAAARQVDAVTGATYSSTAAAEAIRAAAAAYAGDSSPAGGEGGRGEPAQAPRPRAAAIGAALYLAFMAIAPFFVRTVPARRAMLAANVVVLGFLCGMFVSMGRLVGWMASGLPAGGWDKAAAILLLAHVFAFPAFGRPGHYCANVCPFGSAQELAGALSRGKAALPPRLARALAVSRDVLCGALMCSLWLGVWSGWLGWELFAAFAWWAAPATLILAAAATLLLSIAIPRPYCRFACPTGTIIRM